MSVDRLAEIRKASKERVEEAASKNTRPYIDPSDEDRSFQLPIPFKPTMRKVSAKEVFAAKNIPPFDTLPRILIPSPRTQIIPPVMLFGWVANEDFLVSYAKRNNIRQLPPNVDTDDDDDAPLDPGVDDLKPEEIEHAFLITVALERLMNDIDPEWPKKAATLAFAINGGLTCVISIFTNYHILMAPSWERIMLVKHGLGMQEDPKWFLDSERCRWRPNPTLRR